MSSRNPAVLGEWGPSGKRAVAAESYWNKPLAWDRKAKAAGERHRVSCASLADVFEDREELVNPRIRLFDLIDRTPNLDWLLLTKRPEHAGTWLEGSRLQGLWPRPNVWIGTSVENQATANERIPHLLQIPATVRFLSMEPLLGPVDLESWLYGPAYGSTAGPRGGPGGQTVTAGPSPIHWVIVGGESGPKARPMHPQWARSIRDQCVAAGVSFHFKQWGEWAPPDDDTPRGVREIYLSQRGGVTPAASPYDPGCPCCHAPGDSQLVRVGKKAAGRSLDGREWSEFPAATAGATS